jgi:hypothetical protein
MRKSSRPLLALLSALLTAPPLLLAAPAQAAGVEIALSPSRFELPIAPGEERTVVINVISSGGNEGQVRLLATLGDWGMQASGELQYFKPGSTPGSAAPWMVYSPVEFAAKPGATYPIRVTISVPKDATPGDHLAALFVEERPGDLKKRTVGQQINLHFRMAALFYVIVTPASQQGDLTGLNAVATAEGVEVRPKLKNLGNTRLRATHSFQVLDAQGKQVAEFAEAEASVLLAGAEVTQTARAQGLSLPPGEYQVRYRVDFKDGKKVTEGRTRLVVPAAAPANPGPGAAPKVVPTGGARR